MLKNLPIGVSSFKNIIADNACYVDKTPFVKQLFDMGRYYFLSRPRRFGKSLLIDTFKQAFLANKELFNGLYLEHNWDWEAKYPVIHISFGSNQSDKDPDILKLKIKDLLDNNARDNRVHLTSELYSSRFSELI